jgi:hypothetical protein
MLSTCPTRLHAILLLALLTAGCVPSLQPLFTDRDLVFDERLLGAWAEGEESWTFEKRDALSYHLVVREKGAESAFVARLGELRGHRFLDIYPDESAKKVLDDSGYGQSFIPAHGFYKVGEVGGRLGLQVLDNHWFESYLRLHPRGLAHYLVPDHGLVLTASTQDLQRFLLRHSDAFSEEPEFLTRQETSMAGGL